jgi:hypothetical protein
MTRMTRLHSQACRTPSLLSVSPSSSRHLFALADAPAGLRTHAATTDEAHDGHGPYGGSPHFAGARKVSGRGCTFRSARRAELRMKVASASWRDAGVDTRRRCKDDRDTWGA